jgi:hypothetical protein
MRAMAPRTWARAVASRSGVLTRTGKSRGALPGDDTSTDDKRVQSRGPKNGQRRALTTATLSLYFEALTHTAAI